jgi:hypothetical protein
MSLEQAVMGMIFSAAILSDFIRLRLTGVLVHSGKSLGCFASRDGAEHRLYGQDSG